MSRLGGAARNAVLVAGLITCGLAGSAASQEIPMLPSPPASEPTPLIPVTPPPETAPGSDGGVPTTEAVLPATGTLEVLSTPSGVVVEVDGVSVGVTPVVGIVLTPGTHHLRVRGAGLKTQEQSVEITAGQTVHVSIALPAAPTESASFFGTGLDVPLASALLAGSSAIFFGIGLGFGVAANNIQHQAGVNVSTSGVDLGITRAEALQGKTYANTANVLYACAAGTLVAAVIVAVVTPRHPSEPPAASGSNTAPPSGAAWSFW